MSSARGVEQKAKGRGQKAKNMAIGKMEPKAKNKAREFSALTEKGNLASINIDQASALEIAEVMNREDQKVALAVHTQLAEVARAIEIVHDALKQGGRLFYVGAGTSGRLGMLDAVECGPTFNVSSRKVQAIIAGGRKALWKAIEGAEDDQGAGVFAVRKAKIGRKDVVCGISASGTTPFVRAALGEAYKRGARCIFITCQPHPTLPFKKGVLINPIVGPEIIAGSTRLKAGTATKLVLNMISTGAMILLGKVYRNLMIEVRPVSQKLKKRAEKIVTEILGCPAKQAHDLLQKADYEPKIALVMGKQVCSAQEARHLIKKKKELWKELLGQGYGASRKRKRE